MKKVTVFENWFNHYTADHYKSDDYNRQIATLGRIAWIEIIRGKTLRLFNANGEYIDIPIDCNRIIEIA